MGIWNLYFIAKLYLFYLGRLHPQWLLNLLFALLLVVRIRHPALSALRHVLAVVAGAALMYRESDLPPFSRVVSQFTNLQAFTPAYMLELAQRVVTREMLLVALAALVIFWLVNRWVRVTTLVLGALVAVPLWQALDGAGGPGGIAGARAGTATAALTTGAALAGGGAEVAASGPDARLAAFRNQEALRQVSFPRLAATPDKSEASNPQYDVIVLHICSLSWDDLDTARARDNPLLQRFDFLFTNFSSAASYSGPAAIRVLRAACGQPEHKALYEQAPGQCHLFQALAHAGFSTRMLLNHDGHFDNFLKEVQKEIGVDGVAPPPNTGLPVAMRSFDNSPVIGDFDVLQRWFRDRQQAGGGPQALYYNSVTLHDGNRMTDNRLSSLESYPLRLSRLLGDIDKVIEMVAQSGRRAVIVFVPEHGAALRGDANQIAGMREIPTPRIINVPVGVKLVGLPRPNDRTVTIDAPTSYLGLSQLLSNLIAGNPFTAQAPPLATYASDLPQTQMVGENEATVTMREGNGYVVRTPDGVWIEGKP
ncbi:cellulose biosynthesis protein BcsG [Cupriavidus sp. AcVe19-6a]|uniref:cellulose biosynthesis protein BcsG n=1 Tax=Cupriavidus sp. AcVe19-6a TaxID=2821358 RepID=UPI001AE2F171|nr:cellulose biosynthesis protein BcsG [Cupriavidus sp. AcVe19-6a]MBP0637904.1 cellulose biosynthesis protein BcsG [Cupriavidus sp. AcVe19-6a]